MACGTPVVALGNGALPEVVEVGVTGYLARTEDGLAALVRKAQALDRTRVRDRAASRFDLATTAERYLHLYREMIGQRTRSVGAPAAANEGTVVVRSPS